MSTTQDREYDPLEGAEKLPSVSFDPSRGGHAKGERVHLRFLTTLRQVEDRDDDGTPKTFDNGDPMHKIVCTVEEKTKEGWVKKGFWFPRVRKDGALFMEMGKAQREIQGQHPGVRVGPGVEAIVAWVEDDMEPHKRNPKNSPRKVFRVVKWRYTPPADESEKDPWSEGAATADSAAPAGTPAAADSTPAATDQATSTPSGPDPVAASLPAGGEDDAW